MVPPLDFSRLPNQQAAKKQAQLKKNSSSSMLKQQNKVSSTYEKYHSSFAHSTQALNDCTNSHMNQKIAEKIQNINELVDDEERIVTVELEDSDEQLLLDLANQSMVETHDNHKQSQAIHHLLGELSALDSGSSSGDLQQRKHQSQSLIQTHGGGAKQKPLIPMLDFSALPNTQKAQ